MKLISKLFKKNRQRDNLSPSPELSFAVDSVELDFDPLAAGFVEDPYPLLQQLREQQPVHKNSRGVWVLTRYQDVLDALADRRLGNTPSPYAVLNERNRHRYICADVANNILPFMDAPRHNLPRKLISKTFLQYMKQLSPDIDKIGNTLLEELQQKHRGSDAIRFDILEDFATPLSVSVLSEVLGVPRQDEPQLKQWSESFFYLFSIIPSQEIRQQLDQSLMAFRQYFAGLIEQKRQSPGNDLISALLVAGDDKQGLTEAELIDTCMLLFADGVENVDSGIANAVAALLEHPGQLQLLQQQPALMADAVEECLRYQSPAQFIARTALEPLEIDGVSIKQHEGVLLIIGSANRDPAQFPDPDQFIIQREQNNHLSFGKGRHACIGGPLVKLEMNIALTALLRHFRQLEMQENKLQWTPRLGHRWLKELPVLAKDHPA